MAANVSLQLDLETKEAIKAIADFSKKAAQESKKVGEELGSISSGLSSAFTRLGVVAAAAFSVGTIKGFIDSALEADAAVSKLAKSLQVTGDFSQEAIDGFTSFAEELQKVTGFSDELILNQITLVKNLGGTNKQAQEITKTATLLSKALGQDLGSSTETLVKTFSGEVPRSLAKLIPGLKSLSDEQLRAGAAVDLLNEKLGKLSDEGKAFGELAISTQLSVLRENASNLAEEFGNLIIKNDLFVGSLDLINTAILKFTDSIKGPSVSVKELSKGFTSLEGLKGIGIALLSGNINDFKKAVSDAAEPVKNLGKETNKTKKEIGGLGEDFGKTAKELKAEIKSLRDNLSKESSNPIQLIDKEQIERQKLAFDAFAKGAIRDQKELSQILSDIDENAASKRKKEIEKIAQQTSALIAEIAKNPFGSNQADELIKKLRDAGLSGEDIAKNLQLGQITGLVSNIGKGAQGAAETLSQSVALFGTLAPGVTQFVSEILNLFSKGPDAVRGFITDFFSSIPTILNNVLQSIPVAIQSVVDSLPGLVTSLVDFLIVDLPRAIDSLSQQLPTLAQTFAQNLISQLPNIAASAGTALANQMTSVATNFASKLAATAPFIAFNVAKAFIAEIPNIAKSFLTSLIEGLKQGIADIFKGITDVGGIVSGATGGISNIVGDVGKIFGFAEGGTVPSGFPNDNFPARLSSGENVIDRSTNEKLNAFLNSASRGVGGPSSVNVFVQLDKKTLAQAIIDLRAEGFLRA